MWLDEILFHTNYVHNDKNMKYPHLYKFKNYKKLHHKKKSLYTPDICGNKPSDQSPRKGGGKGHLAGISPFLFLFRSIKTCSGHELNCLRGDSNK